VLPNEGVGGRVRIAVHQAALGEADERAPHRGFVEVQLRASPAKLDQIVGLLIAREGGQQGQKLSLLGG